jgi:hypothetical protein
MTTPTFLPNPTSRWKRIALKAILGGAGFAAMLSLIIGVIAWYSSRPQPPQSWNVSAIVAKEPPGFAASTDGKRIELRYVLENTTETDYDISFEYYFKTMMRGKKGTLSQPFSSQQASLALPIFIPSKQKGVVKLSISLAGIPSRKPNQSEDEYHEVLRAYLQDYFKSLDDFVLFDVVNHFQINLPRWKANGPGLEIPNK